MSTTTRVIPVKWNLASVWNEVAFKGDRDLKPRNYIYASEIGSPFCDRWLKMKAEKYTNPPNNRSRRKFLAGNIWEFVTKQILIACGIFHREEVKIDEQPYPGLLEVHGRCDFIAGGYIDEETARMRVAELNLPDFMVELAHKIISSYEGKHLERKILELKSVSTFAMDKVERMRAAIPNHTLQGYHYQKNSKGDLKAAVSYICKDDCRMAEYDVDETVTESLYRDDIDQMTQLFKKKKCPPPAPLSIFDFTLGRFSKNLGVEYSPYLTKIYGFKDPDEYRNSVSFIEKWNRTLSRYVLAETGGTTPTGKPIQITPKNAEVKAEIEKAGYKMCDLIDCKIKVGAGDESEEEI